MEEESFVEYIDEYGFINQWNDDVIARYKEEMQAREKRQSEDWTNFIHHCGGIDQVDFKSSKLKNLIRKGVPQGIRPIVWSNILHLDQKISKSNGLYAKSWPLVELVPKNYLATIENDLKRTFNECKNLSKDTLRKILIAFAVTHPEIGYCQSLNFIAAVLLVVLGDEPAFHTLCIIVEDFLPNDYYTSGMHGFRVDLELFNSILQERTPEVWKHATKLHHEWMLTASGWLLTIFSNSFPIPTVLRIWDAFLVEGPKIVYRVAVGFLRMNHDKFLACTKLATFSNVLAQCEREMIEQDELMELAFGLRAFSRNHIIELRKVAERITDTGVQEQQTKFLHELFGKLNM